MYCWMNGEIIRVEEAKISPFDHGFLYGAGFFETFRTYEGRLFLLEAHMKRLREALAEYRVAMPYTQEEIGEAVATLNELAGGTDGYFRLNVSAGVHDIGLAPSEYASPNVILFRKELAPAVRGKAKKAVWLETSRNSPESRIRHKSHNFLNNIRGRLEIPSLKEMEGLFLTAQGFVAEGVTSNVFWVKNGELFTPAIGTGILPGTTRAHVIVLAEQAGLVVHEGYYTKEDVEKADELFVTNAIQELVPLSNLEGHVFPGAKGTYYKKIHDLYENSIEEMKEGKQ